MIVSVHKLCILDLLFIQNYQSAFRSLNFYFQLNFEIEIEAADQNLTGTITVEQPWILIVDSWHVSMRMHFT
jgi:hypothetical protein